MSRSTSNARILVTGGAGFIGANVASSFLTLGYKVTILDNFSRPRVVENAEWLKKAFPRAVVIEGDIRKSQTIRDVVCGNDIIFHFAGQTAVTASVADPQRDFRDNLIGTFALLEGVRKSGQKPFIIFSSTNKVYGRFPHRLIEESYRYRDELHPEGVDENEQLDFHSPYGCSKGAAEQYVHDYDRIYGIPTVIFRQSCIYGERQFGIAGQGWVAYVTARAIDNKPIQIFGTGKQVRDLLHIDDLVSLFHLTVKNREKIHGEIFNVGGGTNHTVSLLELVRFLEDELGKKLTVDFGPFRPGDQEVYISSIKKISSALPWKPTIGVKEGVRRLVNWTREIS